jgi:hypothetical protein
LASQWKAGAIALLVAAPWWLLNLKAAVVQTQSARGFVRDSLGPPSIATWLHWLSTVIQGLLGCAVSILIFLILIASFRKAVLRKEVILDSFQRVALGACACAGVPILIAQLSGTNHELRHITPAVIPLAIAIGVLADRTGWVRYRAYLAVSSALFCCQLIMLVTPVVFPNDHPVDLGFVNGSLPWRVMVRFDQWDWRPVRDLSYRCGIAMPKISFLGSGRAFCPPQIEYPWVVHETATRKAVLDFPDVTWLWRYEDGPIDWGKVMDTVGRSDIVLTAPHYLGEVKNKEDLDNQYNAEFASRLSQDPRFRGPIRLEMGRFEPVEVDVFLKKSLVCQSGQQASNNQ